MGEIYADLGLIRQIRDSLWFLHNEWPAGIGWPVCTVFEMMNLLRARAVRGWALAS